MHTFMQGKIKNIHIYNIVMKFMYRMYIHCNNFFYKKINRFSKVFMYPIKKMKIADLRKKNVLSTMYNVLMYYETP